ncbi:hypothetical protein [Chryseobacterium sp. SC28]|uniref:hypothetical protein n=1 Tax=Chryseobacterium sp. SC28 TaxID=2268028 RepID=UPI001624FE3F|nr:hypothetical protein [Chryseobacterium sp. SC28]
MKTKDEKRISQKRNLQLCEAAARLERSSFSFFGKKRKKRERKADKAAQNSLNPCKI